MNIKKYSQAPFLYENKESNTMVIFIHGILEGPKQFRKFTEVVYNKGFSYSAILLDGHGGSGKKFANSSMKKWINSVEKEILKYKDKYENIILVGHSMGGLLSILLSLKYKNKVKSLILISTPLKVHVRFDMMISSIKIALEKIKDDAAISVITEDIKNTKVFNIDASNYEDGKYRLSVVAIDKAGNEVIKQVTFNVNKHAPIVKFNGESLKHFYNSKETEITIDINDGNKIDYKNSKVIIKGPNGFKYEGNFAGDNSEVWSDIVTLGEDGEYTVFVKTKDELSEGEVDKEDDVDNFTKIDEKFILDTKAPQINVLTLDGDDYKNIIGYPTFDGVIYLNNDNIKFELNKADELKEFKAKFNGDLNEEITDISAPVKLEDGTYELTITAKDEAGNEAEVQVINFIVDTDPVDVKFDGDIKNGEHYNTDKTLVVTLGGNNLNLSQKNNRVEIVKDGGQPVIEFFDKNEDTFIKDFTEEGAYTVTVFATDKAGNEAIEENTITFTIDKTEPVIIVEDYATLQGSFNKENKTLKIIVNEANLQEDSAINLTYTIPTYDEDGNEVEAKEKVINLLKAEYSSGVYRIEYVVGEDINWDVIESINYAVKFNVKDKSGNYAG